MSRFRCAQAFLGFLLAAAFPGCSPLPGEVLQVVLQVRQEPDIRPETVMSEVQSTLLHRLDELGFSNVAAETLGADRFSLRIPGVRNRERLRHLLQADAHLELRLVRYPAKLSDPSSSEADVLAHFQGQLPGDLEILTEDLKDASGKVTGTTFFAVDRKPVVAGKDIAKARPSRGSTGQPTVEFTLTPEAAAVFSEVTGANIGSRLAIVLDGRVASAPVINARIGDTGIIEGAFTDEQAQDLAILLRSGPLPARLEILEEKVLTPG